MDYLNALPVEIWREILSNITNEQAVLTSHLLSRLHSEEISAVDGDVSRVSIFNALTVCKSLYPIVLEIMYFKVYLIGMKNIRNFLEGAVRPTGGKPNGERTIQLSVNLFKAGFNAPDILNLLIQSCPNLSTICLMRLGAGSLPPLWDRWLENWTSSLTAVYYPDFNLPWNSTLKALSKLNRLKTLRLLSGSFRDGPLTNEQVILPYVENLTWKTRIDNQYITLLTCPRLRWISVNSGGYPHHTNFREFVQRHENTLRGIEMMRYGGFNWLHLIDADFLGAKYLKTIIFACDHPGRGSWSGHLPVIPNPSVETLFILQRCIDQMTNIRVSIQHLKTARFPELKAVKFIAGSQEELDQDHALQKLMDDPPSDVVLQTAIDQYYQ